MSAKLQCLVAILVLSLSVLAQADFTTVGVYDPDDEPHHNQVDQSGVYASHTGSAGAENVLDLSTFQELIGRAFDSDTGGVVNGDSPDDSMGSDDIVIAHFGINGTKSVSLASGNGNLSFGTGGRSGNRLPLSGDGRFARSSGNDFSFTVGEVIGGEPGEAVTYFAGSLVERDTHDPTPMVTATFSDGSTVTATADMAGDDNSPNSKDTFFGFEAPAGTRIEFVEFQLSALIHLDELAFMTSAFAASPELASSPSPISGATDVPRDTILSWTPAEGATQHDVYLGKDYNAVSEADRTHPLETLVSESQDASTFSPALALELGQTYFWRVDAISGATTSRGDVWEFTVEPAAYRIAGERITATASGVSDPNTTGPDKTINGSGLTEEGLHDTDLTTMWLSGPDEVEPAWIQYRFDKMYKLQELQVWNYNGEGLNTLHGLRAVTIETSTDGISWTPLSDVPEFSQAPGRTDYTANTTVAFGSAVATDIRIAAKSNWSGGLLNQYGLSEVRFFALPMAAREPNPNSGQVDSDPAEVTLSWRAGREAALHDVYFGTDPNNLPLLDTTGESRMSTEGLALQLEQTYYWRVDEVNELEVPATWTGDVWEFTTAGADVVDDMESYTGDADAGEAIWQTWADGFEDATNGSFVGDIDGMPETDNVHGGSQSMPFAYGQEGASDSWAIRTFAAGQDWTVMGIQELVVHYQGFPQALVQDPNGTLRMSACGDNMMANNVTADACRFVYKQLNGDGSITARLESHSHIHDWGRVGVMIRETLDAGSVGASLYDAGINGLRIGSRALANANAGHTGGGNPAMANQEEPVWLKLERSGDNINAFFTPDPATQDWIPADSNPTVIQMGSNVLIGLALTSRYDTRPATAVFMDVSTTAAGPWQVADVGEPEPANAPAQLYVAIEDTAGNRQIANHEDGTDSVLKGQWTPWRIPLSGFALVDLTQVKTLQVGVTTAGSNQSGLLLIDDVELQPRVDE